MDNYEMIESRIEENEVLVQYADILHYEWDNEDEHAEWVATAPLSEIVEWCKSILEDEQAQREIDEITDPDNW